MHPEIENLINMAIADGVVTEKEKCIILRKAESLNLDRDEIEMILDGRIALYKRQENTSMSSKANNEGDVKKCPACGAHAVSFSTKCSDCGHEFRNIDVAYSVKKLFSSLKEIEDEVWKTHPERRESIMEHIVRKAIADKQADLLSVFPIPNTKGDILEFLSIAFSEANVKLGFFDKLDLAKTTKKKAYRTKCEQVILKARFAMKEDKKTLEEIEYYAKQLDIK